MIVFLINWAMLAVSLADTILLLWLGSTVLLNAERRTIGIWLVTAALLTAGIFFVSHSAILGRGLITFDYALNLWWHLGLLAAIILPYAWYAAVLWYVGFLDDNQSRLHRRHRPWLIVTTLATAGLGGLLLFANPFPSYEQVIVLRLSPTPTLFGFPILILVYPACTLLSTILSLDAMWRPGPSRRMMGESARRRARPWLIATALVLLLVELLVGFMMLWVVLSAQRSRTYGIDWSMEIVIAYLDLIMSSAILLALLLLGQAIVHYEVFTGKTLPQRRFIRHWRNVVILALGYGAVMSADLQFHFHPINSVLIMAVMVTVFYALFSQSSYVERERYIQDLRPFVLSQRLYDHLVAGSIPAEVDVSVPFDALCRDVLGARLAYLIPLGPLAPLVGPGLAYPRNMPIPALSVIDLSIQFKSPQTMCVALDSARYGGALWVIPLWSERGLIGVLMLGEKSNDSLYTQEEIEIARASGERLIDTQASAQMARRLMALQRQRLAESQVIDRRTRRTLHDDVLPRLHTVMLTLSAGQPDLQAATAAAVEQLAGVHRQIADLLHDMPTTVTPELGRAGLINALRQVLDDDLGSAFDSVDWYVQPEAEQEALAIPLLTAEVIYYAAREVIRNANRHGRGVENGRPLHLRIRVLCDDGFTIVVEDDGVGLDKTASPSNNGGHGLALHSTMMAVIGGSLVVESVPGQCTRVSLALPREAY